MARPSNDDEPIVESSSADSAPNPVWFKPVMIGLMLLGLVWVLIFYISGMQFPIPGIDAWKGGQNPEGRFDGRGRSIGWLRWVWVPPARFGVCREPIGGPKIV